MANILLIDDDELILKSLSRFLEMSGHNVTTTQDGAGVNRLLDRESFDLIITDILMPDTDGIHIIMNTRHDKNMSIPILAISGGGRTDADLYLESAETLGASAVLRKPFTNEELLSMVDRLT